MPQLRGFWWINLISWTITFISCSLLYLQLITFPHILRIQLSRYLLSN